MGDLRPVDTEALDPAGTVVLAVLAFVLLLTVGTFNVLRAVPHHETQKWA